MRAVTEGRREALCIETVTKEYGHVRALSEVSVTVYEGEVYALIGKNGSGKSTLLRCAATIASPDAGTVSHFGGLAGDRKVFGRLGVLFSENAHYERLSGYENAWFFARSYGLSPELARERLDRFFAWASLDARRDDPVEGYSYGMKRKLAVIEAFAHDPGLLILDEPSMGLDYDARLRLGDLIRDAAAEGAAVLLATNDVHEAALIATRCGVLAGGRLVAEGTPEDLVCGLDSNARVELVLTAPVPLEGLRAVPGVMSVEVKETDGEFTVSVLARPGADLLGRAIAAVAGKGGTVVSAVVLEPDLSDVLNWYGSGGRR